MQRLKYIYIIHRILLLVSFSIITLGSVFQWMYINSPKHAVSVSDVEYVITQKEKKADKKIEQIKHILERGHEDSLKFVTFRPQNDLFFVYRDGKLIFWTDNEIKRTRTSISDWKYYATLNAHVLCKRIQVNNYQIVFFILIKHNYPYENNVLINNFDDEFNLNKEIQVVDNQPKSKYAIYDKQGKNYLFTLQLPPQKIYDESIAKTALILFSISFLLLFYIYAHLPLLFKRRYFTWKEFLLALLGMSIAIFGCLSTNIPLTFFSNNIFTSFHYASNTLFATLTHLTFFTAFVFSSIFLYTYYVKKRISNRWIEVKKVALLLLPAIYFVLMFYVLKSLVFNSSTNLNILRIDDISTTAVWNHLLLLLWGTGYMLLFIKTHRVSHKKKSLRNLLLKDVIISVLVISVCFFVFDEYDKEAVISYVGLTLILYFPLIYPSFFKPLRFLIVFMAAFAFFVVNNSIRMNADKKKNQYHLLAENLFFNESSQEEKYTESMLKELDKDLSKDVYFKKNIVFPDSIINVNDYLNNKYLRGFWNKYEMKLFATYPQSDIDKTYRYMIDSQGNKITNTHFYKITGENTDIAYLGAFQTYKAGKDSVHIFMEFYARSNYKSYSYPNLLVESPASIQSQLDLSVARYSCDELIYSIGKFKYPKNEKWIQQHPSGDFHTQDFAKYRHYIYSPSKYNYMIISESEIPSLSTYFIYLIYTFVAFLLISVTIIWISNLLERKEKVKYNLTSRLLFAFVSLMAVCFAAIFYVSVTYTQKRYKEKQLADIDAKKGYIQNALQEKYYWTQHLDSTMVNALNFDLQDLSYIYRTDINVYDNEGRLVGTSQPIIFSRNLISKLISPKPYFSSNADIDQYERIGKLEYLATYCDFYNGDNLPIGYISIPHFLSKDEYNAEVQSFLIVIAHISLIIILLFILSSILIGKRLTAPLTIIENRLKDIRVGKENKKIDYRGNDEIGQLVAQYNRMVDELERSAELLASSERQSAWRQMARQVAHEINNPLTPMKLTIQQLQRTKTTNDKRFDSYFEKSTNTLIEQIDNLSRIAGTFSTFARLPEPNLEKVDVAKRLSLVTQLFSNSNKNITVQYEGASENVFAYTDKEQLIQVFNNLLKNAVQAIPTDTKGEIKISLSYSERTINIFIEDNGKGIPEEIKDKLFTPNFTTKSTGMGLGLAISRNIIRTSGGDINFNSEIGKGSVFHITLPKNDL
ncbi:MAG: HAMP domain-containing sensor histidine kinase [Paludibacteraceae bacterium]